MIEQQHHLHKHKINNNKTMHLVQTWYPQQPESHHSSGSDNGHKWHFNKSLCILFFTTLFSYCLLVPQKILEIIIHLLYCTRQDLLRKQWNISQHDTKVFQVRWQNLSQTENISSAGLRARWTRFGKPLARTLLVHNISLRQKGAASRNSPSSSPPHLHLHNFIFLILYWYRSGGIQIKNHRSITGPSFLCNTNFSIN